MSDAGRLLPTRKEAAGIVRPRMEFLLTMAMDSAMIAGSLIGRWVLLWVFHFMTDAKNLSPFLDVLEFILNYGLVVSAVIMTGFDLAKRVRDGYRSLVHDRPPVK